MSGSDKKAKKQGTKFKLGQSGNPAERPRGSRNATTLALEAQAPTESNKQVVQAPSELKSIGGSISDAWNNLLANQVLSCVPTKYSDERPKAAQLEGTIAALVGIGPQNELEGMIAAQLLASHNAAMDCYRRAMLSEQTIEARGENLGQANKLSRTFSTLLEALNRHRGKGQQKVTVEHVHVHAGGQAVVGLVEPPRGRGQENTKDQPHAKQLTYEPQQALRSADEEREALPVAGDAERSLPDARRSVARSTKR
jgi:hypothetical protein